MEHVERVEDWRPWQADLVAHLRSLHDRGYVNTWGPSTQVPGRGLLGRVLGERPWAPTVAVLRLEDELVLTTAYPSRHEPHWLPDARDRLRAAGWLGPHDVRHEQGDPEDLCRYLPLTAASQVAELAVQAYAVLGVTGPEQVEIEVVRSP